jgi:hypothetical protein
VVRFETAVLIVESEFDCHNKRLGEQAIKNIPAVVASTSTTQRPAGRPLTVSNGNRGRGRPTAAPTDQTNQVTGR